jgi:F-type H+-transporting ATPase subunit delta
VKNLRVANRYAKALLGLATENNFQEQAFEDMKLAYQVFEFNKELEVLLKSPIVRVSKKLNILKSIFEGKIHPVTMMYMNLVAKKKRASLLKGIAFEYLNIHRETMDVEMVMLITAGEIDDSLMRKAQTIAKSLTKRKNIEFDHITDSRILGGFILRIGDIQYDASIKRKLSVIKKQLLEN